MPAGKWVSKSTSKAQTDSHNAPWLTSSRTEMFLVGAWISHGHKWDGRLFHTCGTVIMQFDHRSGCVYMEQGMSFPSLSLIIAVTIAIGNELCVVSQWYLCSELMVLNYVCQGLGDPVSKLIVQSLCVFIVVGSNTVEWHSPVNGSSRTDESPGWHWTAALGPGMMMTM